MIAGVPCWRCADCGASFFPEQFLCPRCRGGRLRAERVGAGIVEEVTVVRHAIGREDTAAPVLASVRTEAGHRMIVRLDGVLAPGTPIALCEADGVLRGRNSLLCREDTGISGA